MKTTKKTPGKCESVLETIAECNTSNYNQQYKDSNGGFQCTSWEGVTIHKK